MRVIFMGTPDFSVRTLEALVEAGYEITGVVTQPDKPKGRGKQMMPTPVKEAAEKHGLPVYQPRRVRDAEAIEEIRKMEPDVIVVVAFGQIIPKEILDMPKYGCINVHASLLPAYRGAAPIQWAVMNGDEVSGVTIMLFMPSALLPTVSIQAEKVSSVHTEGGSLSYGVGDRVSHMKFGEGTVKAIVPGGRDFEVTVDFDAAGTKKMFAAFAKLKKV